MQHLQHLRALVRSPVQICTSLSADALALRLRRPALITWVVLLLL